MSRFTWRADLPSSMAILWKERSAAAKAAEALKISAKDLLALGLVDEIVPESAGGAHNNPAETAAALKAALLRNLEDLKKLSSPDLLKLRYDKFRAHGRFTEKIETPATSPALASLAASLAPPIAAPEAKLTRRIPGGTRRLVNKVPPLVSR
jgi:enoyl-CoA hydratase/carnithine racemase